MIVLDAFENVDNILPDIPGAAASFGDFMDSLGHSIMNALTNFLGFLRNGVVALHDFGKSVRYLNDNIYYLSHNSGLPIDIDRNFVNFDNYIGNIRFMVGDVVFLQLYAFLLIGFGWTIFMLVVKLVKALRYLFATLTGIPFFNNFFEVIKRKIGFLFN